MQRRWIPYLVAVFAVAVALALRYVLDPWLGVRIPYITIFGGIIITAWYGGAKPAILAAVLGWICSDILFVEPRGRVTPVGLPQLLEMSTYALSSLLIAALGGAMHRARRRTEESEHRFRAFMQNSPSGVFLKDEDGRYVFMNRTGERLAGRTDWPGRKDEELFDAATAKQVRANDRTVLEADAGKSFILTMPTPEGERTLHSVKFPLRDILGQRYVGSITTDITERQRSERALQEADRRKDQFIATLAHELRNPLAPIRSAVQILGRSDTTEPDRAWSRGVIERQVAHMSRLVDDLLDVARISSGKLLLRRERIALGAVVNAAIETSRPAIDAGGQRLVRHLDAADAVLDADPTRLAQVISNLLNNAAKYTPSGGTIELRAERGGNDVVLVVRDDGIGFPPEVAEQLFEPFTQWAPAGQVVPGLGIGLSLVRGIIELHGGSVGASSAGAGKGSRFEIRLPIAAQGQPALRSAAAAEPVAAPGVRVLVADDNRDAADTLGRILSLYGYEVRCAYDGNAALAACESFRPHVAVLDLGMPARSGYDVAREVRERRGAEVTLIALTGWGSDEDVRRARDAGFDHHVTKPVDARVLNEMISRA